MKSSNNPLARWHQIVRAPKTEELLEILADEVTFFSPVVWTPQEGKQLTAMYLAAAAEVLGKNDFEYLREIVSENHACLEFSANVEGVIVNGVDLIEWNEAGKITSFKVMIRPLKAIQKVHQKMYEMLERLKGGGAA